MNEKDKTAPVDNKTTPEMMWKEYQKGVAYNSGINLVETVRQNELFYIGKQWEGTNAPDLEKGTMNILRRVVTYFIAAIVSDDIAVNASDMAKKAGLKPLHDMLSAQFAEVMELANCKARFRDALRDSAVDGSGCVHYYFDPDYGAINGLGTPTPGRIVAEILNSTNVYFGNPQEQEVQKQPYIILAFRRMLDEVKKAAEQAGNPDAEKITADSDDNEVGTKSGDDNNKVTVLRKYYKKGGTVWFCETTKDAVIKGDTDTGYRLYPLAWLVWEKVKNQYHGHAAITDMIPNQILINKLFAMATHHVKTMAFPKIVYDNAKLPDGWSNKVGEAIPVNGNPNDAVAAHVKAADMSSQVLLMIEKLIQYTRDTMGASDAALGNIKADNTSAIIAVQKATAAPLELQRMAFYEFVEESVRIWFEIMVENFGTRYVELPEGFSFAAADGGMPQQGMPQQPEAPVITQLFDFSQLRNLGLRLNVDIGASSYFSELVQVRTLDNLLSAGIITDAEAYIELIPASYLPNKQLILEHIRKEKEQQAMAQQPAEMPQPEMPPLPDMIGGAEFAMP